MSARTTLWAALLLFPFTAASGCGGSRNPVEPGPVPGGGQACRTYATEWSTVYTFAQPTTTSASFNPATRVYSEFQPAGSQQLRRRVSYASTADFVDEAAAVGRTLARETVFCTIAGCPNGEVLTYDAQRRLTRLARTASGLELNFDMYTAWDGLGRPTAGTQFHRGLCELPLAFTYDDVSRTMTGGPTGPGTGAFCLLVLLGSFPNRAYDADGNVIRETESAGGTSTTATHTITARSQVCK